MIKKLKRKISKMLVAIGNAFCAKNRHQTALRFYERAICWDAENASAYNNIANICLKYSCFDDAKKYYDKAIEMANGEEVQIFKGNVFKYENQNSEIINLINTY